MPETRVDDLRVHIGIAAVGKDHDLYSGPLQELRFPTPHAGRPKRATCERNVHDARLTQQVEGRKKGPNVGTKAGRHPTRDEVTVVKVKVFFPVDRIVARHECHGILAALAKGLHPIAVGDDRRRAENQPATGSSYRGRPDQ